MKILFAELALQAVRLAMFQIYRGMMMDRMMTDSVADNFAEIDTVSVADSFAELLTESATSEADRLAPITVCHSST